MAEFQTRTVQGMFGTAIQFDRTAGWVLLAQYQTRYSQYPLTIECRVRIDSADRENQILMCGYPFHNWGDLSAAWRLATERGTGRILFAPMGRLTEPIQLPARLEIGTWHQIAIVNDTNLIRVSLDGQEIGTGTPPANLSGRGFRRDRFEGGPLFFGGDDWYEQKLDGAIEEVRLSRAIRTGTATGRMENDQHTIGLWRFGDMRAGRVRDLSRVRNDARAMLLPDSHDLLDLQWCNVQTSPWKRAFTPVKWMQVRGDSPSSGRETFGAEEILLDGKWECVEAPANGRSEDLMLDSGPAWKGSFPCTVPSSIQTALLEAGRIEDPNLLKNNLDIQWVAEREWWLRKKFRVPASMRGADVRLFFDGVDYRATFWLNGYRLGQHEGMYGGPDFDVGGLLRFGGENLLVVQLDPAPGNYQDTLKCNVAYGWHYVKMVTLGIWRSVRLQARRGAVLEDPFLATKRIAARGAEVELSLDVWSRAETRRPCTLECSLLPKNFEGTGFRMSRSLSLSPGRNAFGFRGLLPDAALWWPNGMGDPNLYRFECVLRQGRKVIDRYCCNWGARTIEMAQHEGQPHAKNYRWQFVVNGRWEWVKGTNYCYPDSLFRLGRQRQARFVELARHARIQLFRVWGGGPAENEELYDLCDEQGIMVQQEFSSTGSNRFSYISNLTALDTTHYTVRRLRNRPSLALWGGNNESSGLGRLVDAVTRRCYELDGTRAVHRTDPYGGAIHWYGVYWNRQPLLDYRKAADGREAVRWGTETGPVAMTEFGLSSPANIETWRKILPPDELKRWPPNGDSAFVHHTPTWIMQHIDIMAQYAGDFLEPDSLEKTILGMQISQGLGLQYCIESMRARKPQTTATYFYKLTEGYPSCSWATIDYYGRPKLSHWHTREAYAPIHVSALFDSWDPSADRLPVSIRAVNDTTEEYSGVVRMTLWDGSLSRVLSKDMPVVVPTDRAIVVSEEAFEVAPGMPRPLFLCLDLTGPNGRIDRNWYFFSFTAEKGCLFTRPKTRLEVHPAGTRAAPALAIRCTGELPALYVTVDFGDASDTWYPVENCLFLEPGEQLVVPVRKTLPVEGKALPLSRFTIRAWNADPIESSFTPSR